MGFVEAVKTCLFEKYATFSGRASRSEFWWFFLFQMIIYIILNALFFGTVDFAALMDPDQAAGAAAGIFSGASGIVMILQLLFTLAILCPYLAVGVRRLHDTNKSGWWMLLFLLMMIPFVGLLVLVVMLVLWALKGTAGENRFGPDPLA